MSYRNAGNKSWKDGKRNRKEDTFDRNTREKIRTEDVGEKRIVNRFFHSLQQAYARFLKKKERHKS